MEEKHKEILLKYHVQLVQQLDPKKICPYLIQEKVLTFDERETFKGMARCSQCEELLALLPRKGPGAYGEFVNALEKEQAFLACLLLRDGR